MNSQPEPSVSIETIQNLINQILGIPNCEVKRIGVGATSAAWYVRYGKQAFILRAMRPNTNRPITYRSESAILQKLYAKRLCVPVPFLNSFEQSLNSNFPAWVITYPVPGKPLLNRKLTPATAAQLGNFLGNLHELPCTNYGRLVEDCAMLQGQHTTPLDGIRGRWCWARLWPFDQSLLAEHPIANVAYGLIDSLRNLETTLWDITTDTQGVINHSDLHGEHIFLQDDQLSGVIDFGAAFIGVPGWEFAVVAYYHGWLAAEAVLDGYTQSTSHRRDILHQAYLLALVVSLYKLQKAVAANVSQHKIQRIVQFTVETAHLCV